MSKYIPYLIIMAGVTYAIRMLPITLCQKELKNPFIKSFLFYMPYAVLGSMTFPAVFMATGNVVSSTVGCLFAFYFAWKEKSLITVAIVACVGAYITSLFLTLL